MWRKFTTEGPGMAPGRNAKGTEQILRCTVEEWEEDVGLGIAGSVHRVIDVDPLSTV